jgi:hypothetical protein
MTVSFVVPGDVVMADVRTQVEQGAHVSFGIQFLQRADSARKIVEALP